MDYDDEVDSFRGHHRPLFLFLTRKYPLVQTVALKTAALTHLEKTTKSWKKTIGNWTLMATSQHFSGTLEKRRHPDTLYQMPIILVE